MAEARAPEPSCRNAAEVLPAAWRGAPKKKATLERSVANRIGVLLTLGIRLGPFLFGGGLTQVYRG
jgi:hypothetical protein